MELELALPASLSNSYFSTSDEEIESLDDENDDDAGAIEIKSDSPRPPSVASFLTYNQFHHVLGLLDSAGRLTPISEEPELEYWEAQNSSKEFYTGAVRKRETCVTNLTKRTLSGSSVIVKSSSTCCFVWLKTLLKSKLRRTKKFE